MILQGQGDNHFRMFSSRVPLIGVRPDTAKLSKLAQILLKNSKKWKNCI